MSRRYVLDLISEVEFYSKLQSGFPLIKAIFNGEGENYI